MTNKIFLSIVGAFMIVSAIGFSGSIYADNDGKRTSFDLRNNIDIRVEGDSLLKWSYGPSILGTVTAVNGETLTVKAGTSGSYTVDASAAKIRKGDEVQALSSISVGDTVLVQGAINGSSVIATMIVETKSGATIKPDVKENMSGVVGKVTAINGNTITIQARNDVSYTINAINAKFWKNKNNSSTIAEVKVGDLLIVQGTINGTSVNATNIIDVNAPVNNNMSVITGTVTAMSDTTITLKAANGTVYTVAIADATFKDNKNKDYDKGDIKVGDTVTVKGTVNGTTITASSVTEGKIRGNGFFHKFGNFFRHLFGNK
jgi:hypothetical protein